MGAAALITLNTMAINWHPSVNGTAPSYAGLIAEAVSQAGGLLRDGAPTLRPLSHCCPQVLTF